MSDNTFTLGETSQEILREISDNSRLSFQRGNNRALMDMIVTCAQLHMPLPAWAATGIVEADHRFRTGRLNSWEDVFGKPFPGKRRKGALTRSRKMEVRVEVRHFIEQSNVP